MRRLLWLYPPAWRARYEAEVADLLDALPADRSTVLDLIRGAVVERARAARRLVPSTPIPDGGPPMFEHPFQRHPTSLGLLALLLVVPTFVFVVISLLAYEIEVPGMAAAVEPGLRAVSAARWVDLFILGAPFLAFVVAVIPMVGIGWRRSHGELSITLAFRGRAFNAAVLVLCVVLGGLLVSYLISEFLFEARLG